MLQIPLSYQAWTGKLIRLLILFSILLGMLFLWEVVRLVPGPVFYFLLAGWVAFLVDGLLTFSRPKLSYYLTFSLAVIALVSSFTESTHYALVQSPYLLSGATFVSGSSALALLVVITPYHFLRERRLKRQSMGGTRPST